MQRIGRFGCGRVVVCVLCGVSAATTAVAKAVAPMSLLGRTFGVSVALRVCSLKSVVDR